MSDAAKKPQEETGAEPAKEETRRSLVPKLMIGGFISLVAIAETAIFFLLVPSAEEVAALAEAKVLARVEAEMEADGQTPVTDQEDLVDFPLGEYGVSFIPPGSDRQYRVEFQLFGSVRAKNQRQLEEIYARKKASFQHRIMLEIRNATVDELMENQLGLIQRRLLATSNEVLSEGEPLILGVSLPGYTVMEE
ncbi:MAG: dihydrolipoamide acetyltransferase [Pirellulaceae bacterium]|nr:MAG: dihydrolipoamide acetyltransferase [Pirellulaceae bacterium]